MATVATTKEIAEPIPNNGEPSKGLVNDINTLTTTGYFKVSEHLHIRRLGTTSNLQLYSDHPAGNGEIFISIGDAPALARMLDELHKTKHEA